MNFNLLSIIDTAFEILIMLVIVRAIISFIPHDPHNSVWRFVYDITEPMMRPFRRFGVGGGGFGIDFSPLIVIILLNLARSLVLNLVRGLLY